jgi:hypothetical protein
MTQGQPFDKGEDEDKGYICLKGNEVNFGDQNQNIIDDGTL